MSYNYGEIISSSEMSSDPRLVTLLGSAGLTEVDIQIFDNLRNQGMSVFIHGSIVAKRLTPKSDIDFSIIGKLEDLSPKLIDTLIPNICSVSEYRNVDYYSTSIVSQNGRKLSLHISEPDFRDNHPANIPYSTEYRTDRHSKQGDRKYFLPGVDRAGVIHLINFVCSDETINGINGTFTNIPQTGRFTLDGNSVYVGDEKANSMSIDKVIKISQDGKVSDEITHSEADVMILGLEFDKMQSDTPLYNDPSATKRYVYNPTKRCMDFVGEFSGNDPNAVTQRLFSELAKYWNIIKPNKTR